jgi:hypothetical protein
VKKHIGQALWCVGLALTVWFCADLLWRWYRAPELTQMQLLIKYWKRYIIAALGIAFVALGQALE